MYGSPRRRYRKEVKSLHSPALIIPFCIIDILMQQLASLIIQQIRCFIAILFFAGLQYDIRNINCSNFYLPILFLLLTTIKIQTCVYEHIMY